MDTTYNFEPHDVLGSPEKHLSILKTANQNWHLNHANLCDYGINTKEIVSPSVFKIFERFFLHAIWKQFLHILCADITYVVAENFVVDCLEDENMSDFGGGSVWGNFGYLNKYRRRYGKRR